MTTISTSPAQPFGADRGVAEFLGRTIDSGPAMPFVRTGRTPSATVKPLPAILTIAPDFRARPRSKAPGGLRVRFGRVLYLEEPEGYPRPLPMQAAFWPSPVPQTSIPVLPAVTKKRLRSTTVPQMWIMDTGCGRDLIGKNDLSKDDFRKCRPARDPVTFNAAGANVNADMTLSLKSIALGEAIDAYVLERCPAALNVAAGAGVWAIDSSGTTSLPTRCSPFLTKPLRSS